MRYLPVPLNPLFEKSERGFALSLSFFIGNLSLHPARQTIHSLFSQCCKKLFRIGSDPSYSAFTL